jgi:hypothetical protein
VGNGPFGIEISAIRYQQSVIRYQLSGGSKKGNPREKITQRRRVRREELARDYWGKKKRRGGR